MIIISKETKNRWECACKKKSRNKNRSESLAEKRRVNRSLIQTRKAAIPSGAEQVIINFLKANSIPFIREHFYFRLTDPLTNKVLFFDFYLPTFKLYIEFDGKHHFEPVYGDDKLKTTQYHDQLKNDFCAAKGRKLLRIPYWCSDIEKTICQFFDQHF